MGRISARQARQTGSREILIKGVLQRRQSEGKKVANRLSATRRTEENRTGANKPFRGATLLLVPLAPVARIGSPLLLKTNLPRSPVAAQRRNRTNLPQYSGRPSPRQRPQAPAVALRADLDSRRSRTCTENVCTDRLWQSPQRTVRRKKRGRMNFSANVLGRERYPL